MNFRCKNWNCARKLQQHEAFRPNQTPAKLYILSGSHSNLVWVSGKAKQSKLTNFDIFLVSFSWFVDVGLFISYFTKFTCFLNVLIVFICKNMPIVLELGNISNSMWVEWSSKKFCSMLKAFYNCSSPATLQIFIFLLFSHSMLSPHLFLALFAPWKNLCLNTPL